MKNIEELFPAKYTLRHSYIFDGEGKMCMNAVYDDIDLVQKLLDKLNGDSDKTADNKFYLSDNKQYIMYIDRKIFLVRAWGWLTGVGGMNYTNNDASEIQTIFLNYVIKTLNK